MTGRGALYAGAFLGCLALGCDAHAVPDPRTAAEAYGAAMERGDADALHAMMTEEAQKARTRDDLRRIVAQEKDELREQGRAFAAKSARITAVATLRYEDGEESTLELDRGRFWVTSAGALPGGAHTPTEALDQLRRVLARRSYAGLMRVLSPSTRAAVEDDLRTLVLGLERPETLDLKVTGETASVTVKGHRVKLRREGGLWRVEDFD